jgi:adenosylmethionine-8-amino-7-oxononanoate aminotransferase
LAKILQALGCVPAASGYLKAMKAVCDCHGALLILDEVMCGMGRTGTLHAWEQEGVVPDIQTIGKGLGGGYVPVAGILINQRIVDALDHGSGSFSHGQTYQGHPMACAAALEVQRIIREDNLLNNVKNMGVILESLLRQRLESHPNVGDIRGRGLFWGIEFVEDKASKRPFPPSLAVGTRIHDRGMSARFGISLYPGAGTVDGVVGDHILIAPPYNSTNDEIKKIVDLTTRIVEEVFEEISEDSKSA